MNLSASPALKQVESSLGISSGTFSGKHYHSVFDIIRQSRKQFITTNISWLGSRSGTAWDLAMGQAQYIRRLFRESRLTRQIRETLPRTLSGHPVRGVTPQTPIQGLVQDGPDWQNQFGSDWEAYCQSGSPEAFDSPVSYLTWLYNQAMEFEQEMESAGGGIISLSERRPDLATMMVDNDAVNQEIPALQLVNEILESNIATTLGAGSTVDETLAVTRYPTLLPYHFPHDQAELSLLNADIPLEDIIGQTSTDWPWFLRTDLKGASSNSATELASRLAPEQQTIVTELAQTDLTAFYKTNLGLDTADYSPFEELDTFTYQLGITVPQTEKLLAGNAGGTSVVISKNVDQTSYIAGAESYGAWFINVGKSPAVQLNYAVTDTVTGENAIPGAGSAGYAPSESMGKINGGLKLYGTKQNFLQPGSQATAAFSGAADFTLGFWFCPNVFPVGSTLPVASNCSNYNAGKTGFGLGIEPTGQLLATAQSSVPAAYCTITSDLALKLNTWYYITLQWNISTWELTLSVSDNGAVPVQKTSKISDTTGNVTSDTGTAWTFNESGTCSYYTTDVKNPVSFVVDDICIWKKLLTEADIQAVAASASVAGGRNDMDFHYALDMALNYLSDPRMDRINRMVRLQRWLGLTYEETDLLLRACIAAQGANNTDFSLNIHTLRALGVFCHWQQKYGVTAFQFAAVLHQITPYAISPAVPFLDLVFNAPSLFEEPFAITVETINYTDVDDSSSSRVVKQLCAGLGLTQAQFRVLADKVGDSSTHTFSLTLDSVSAFYRLAQIPRWLGLSFAEGAALFSLVGQSGAIWTTLAKVPQLATLSGTPPQPASGDILDTLMALDAAADWAKEHGLSWVKNYLDLQTTPDALVASSGTVNFVNSIKQQLPATLLSEQSFVNIPQPSSVDPVAFTCPAGGTRVPGIINGSARLLDSTKKQYGQFTDDANTLADGSKDYSLGFWVNIPATTTTSVPVAACGDYNKQGIFISRKDTSNLQVTVYDNTGATVTPAVVAFPSDTWFYLALTLDTATKKLMVYTCKQDGTVISGSLDYSSLTGAITTAAGNVWRLNEDGVNTFYKNWGNNHAQLSYDDVTLWNSVLTETNITDIVKSGKTANETVPATISGTSSSLFTNWMDTLGDLVTSEGLVLPAATDYNTTSSRVQADTAELVFDASVDASQVDDTLSGIIYQAMLTQNGIADSALAQMFNTPQALSPFLFRWATDSEYRLLTDSLTMNNGGTLTDPTVIPADYLTQLYSLGQRAGIASQFSLTPAALSTFLAHPGWLDPTFTTTLTLSVSLLYRLSRYNDWLKLAIKEDVVLAYLTWVNGTTPPSSDNAAKALAVLLSWEGSEVEQATAGLPGNVLIARTVADVDYVMRLQWLSAKTGLSVTPLLDTGQLEPGNVADTWDKWQAAGESLVAAQTENK